MESSANLQHRWTKPATAATAAVTGLWAIYALIFFATGPLALSRAALTAAVNVLPLACLAAAAHVLLKRWTPGRSPGSRILVHAGMAIAFSLLWYAAVVLGLAIVRGFETGRFFVQGFHGPALSWQSLQGLCLYAVVAALSRTLPHPVAGAATATSHAASHYLVKADDGLIPVRVEDIVCLQGAHDYVQMTTPASSHLVRHGLADFAARLDPDRFIRIHRSVVVNIDYVKRVEPVGAGKLRVVLANGQTLSSSRAGAQRLRSMTI